MDITGMRVALALMALLFVLAPLACASCSDTKPPPKPTKTRSNPVVELTIDTGGEKLTISTEVVASAKLREKGLMYRQDLEEGEGMLFVFEAEEERSFWMKNTLIPLDILFVGNDRTVVGIVHRAKPRREKSLSVGAPSLLVQQVPGGYCSRNAIHRRAKLDFKP